MKKIMAAKPLRPARRPELAHYLETTYRVSERRGCKVLRNQPLGASLSHHPARSAVPRGRIREIAAARVRYGYFRIYLVLRREGLKINHQRVYPQ
jgi:putative transposase